MGELLQKKVFSRAVLSSEGCLEWQGARSAAGYGQVWFNGRLFYTHRVIAQIYLGNPESNQEVMHVCDNRICCAPSHLQWGTRKQNMLDASQKGRLLGRGHAQGTAHPMSKMTSLQVAEAISLRQQGKMLKDLASKYGVSIAAIQKIVTGRTRKNG